MTRASAFVRELQAELLISPFRHALFESAAFTLGGSPQGCTGMPRARGSNANSTTRVSISGAIRFLPICCSPLRSRREISPFLEPECWFVEASFIFHARKQLTSLWRGFLWLPTRRRLNGKGENQAAS